MLRRFALAFGLVLLVGVGTVYFGLRASLPSLDGHVAAEGLAQAATLERDALGIPTIEAASRTDLAFATGYAHAQDRFFQMDLSRRLAAGELVPLFGEIAEPQDAKARAFGFRRVARRVLEQATPNQREIVEAYTQGVNAGLASLRSRPFEYWVLRSVPVAWKPEDTVLVVYAMWWDLQYGTLRREQLRRMIDARLGGPVTAFGWKRASCFLSPPRTGWDAPNESGAVPATEPLDCLAIPSREELDVRGSVQATGGHADPGRSMGPTAAVELPWMDEPLTSMVGSNNWALAGARTASGGALVASDMHLGLRVPAVWYRARLKTGGIDLNGVTLPGAPVMVAGSNGSIAWSFSNSYGDWADVERRPCEASGDAPPADGDPASRSAARIDGPDPDGRCWFASWLAAVPEATNLRLLDFETAKSVEEALAIAPEAGIPHQNLIVGDREGHIAWTIIGRIPRATGPHRNEGASGWLSAQEQPGIVDPPSGQLWTANSLATDIHEQERIIGDDEAVLGADYDLGARARQIRDDLTALVTTTGSGPGNATPADMLAIQLDDRAVFLTRWRDLLLELLGERATRGHAGRAELERLVHHWDARAGADSAGYRLVRDYRDRVEAAVWQMILQALSLPGEDQPPPAHFERPLWSLVTQRPLHMLSPRYADWRAFLLAQADEVVASREKCAHACPAPVRVRHPLSRALPLLSGLLDMPEIRLPGDRDMPRVQSEVFGASERFAVTPGREAEGYMHIAGGQSGHPLSPYYRAGFAEWAEGRPLPFLPGRARHRLELRPR